MGLDPLSAIAPARVKALIIPLGRIRQSRFASFISRLQQQNIVQLGDVSPDGRPHRTMFSPLAFPAGLVLYDLSTSLPPLSHLALAPFELYREPLIVVAIADGSNVAEHVTSTREIVEKGDETTRVQEAETDGFNEQLLQGLEKLQVDFPKALVHHVLVFDFDELNVVLPDGITAVPSPTKSKTTTIKTIMCDLTSDLLAEMTSYAKSLQALPTVESPKPIKGLKALNGSQAHLAAAGQNSPGSSRPPSADQKNPSTLTANEHLHPSHSTSIPKHMLLEPSNRFSTPDSRSLSPSDGFRTPPTTFSEMKIDHGISSRDAKISGGQEKISMYGFGAGSAGERERNKGKGRIGTVIGALYLLAGRWPDAIKEFTESAAIAKANSDYLWHGKALDYLLVCLLLYAWAGMDFQIPEILHTGVERPNSGSTTSTRHTPSNSLPDLAKGGSPDPLNQSVTLQRLTGLLPDLVHQILNLYVRAWTFSDDKTPQLSFSDSTIRFSKLLTVVNLSRGILDDAGLQRIVLNTDIARTSTPPTQPSSFLTKAELTHLLFRAFPGDFRPETVSIVDRTTILSGVASVLLELGYQRKAALVLRELFTALVPALVQARKDGAAEMGLHPAASLASLDMTFKTVNETNAELSHNELESGIQSFLSLICQIYEIPFLEPRDLNLQICKSEDFSASNTSNYDNQETIIARALQQTSMKSRGNQLLKLDVLRSCIDICEALPDLSGVLRFSAHMLRIAGSGIIPGPESNVNTPTLLMEEQIRLANNISRAISAARQLGLEKAEAEYWDEFLIRSIEVAETDSSKSPTPHTKADLGLVKAIEKEEKNPFIYNPFRKSGNSAGPENLLVAQEEAMFRVTLQNLYDFDVEIEQIKINSSGLKFDPLPQSGLIGPYRMQTLVLTGIPKEPGSLNITGCKVKVKGCRERNFPIFNASWTPTPEIKVGRSEVGNDGREKTRPVSNLSNNSKVKKPDALQGPVPSSIALTVVAAQPSIVMKSITLPQSAIMLLEGETKTFTIVLQNISSIPVNLLFLSFNDSTAPQLRAALANKELSPVELYELELASIRKPTFRWQRTVDDKDINIGPGAEISLRVEVLGKPGLSHGTIQVDYGHLRDSGGEVATLFYTRQLVIPITATVNASVEVVRNNLVPFTGDFAWRNKQRKQLSDTTNSPPQARRQLSTSPLSSKEHNRFQSLLGRIGLNPDDSDHCLLTLDLRNSWPSLLSISIDIRSPNPKDNPTSEIWTRAYTVHEPIQPGHTSRILLILPCMYLSQPHAPIPSLTPATKRQYIVSSGPKPNPDAELATREAFHYREALLDHIRATWEEESTHRTGAINLRALHLTMRMVSALKLDDLNIQLSIRVPPSPSPQSQSQSQSQSPTPPPTPKITQLSPTTYSIPTSTFLLLTTTLTNRSPHPIRPLLRLQPALRHQPHNVALDLGKKFLWTGLLQRGLDVLGPGETVTKELRFVVLCRGAFEVGAVVEEVRGVVGGAVGEGVGGSGGDGGGSDRKHGVRGEELGISARRVWYCKERVAVFARDEEEG